MQSGIIDQSVEPGERRRAVSAFLVRLGQLSFGDFHLLPESELHRVATLPEARQLLAHAFHASPVMLSRFRHACSDLRLVGCRPDEIATARDRLTRMFALELLREKAPPLYDALPWNAWDTGVVAERYRLWRTKVLVQGEQACFTAANLPRTAGLYVLETSTRIRRYIERKCELERVRHFNVLEPDAGAIPLADRAVDLAVVGPPLGPEPEQTLAELGRVACSILLLFTRPGSEDLIDDDLLAEHGFTPDQTRVGEAVRPYWWRFQPA